MKSRYECVLTNFGSKRESPMVGKMNSGTWQSGICRSASKPAIPNQRLYVDRRKAARLAAFLDFVTDPVPSSSTE